MGRISQVKTKQTAAGTLVNPGLRRGRLITDARVITASGTTARNITSARPRSQQQDCGR